MNETLIIGGTGTLGHEITRQLLRHDDTNTSAICIFSRDEQKQAAMAQRFTAHKTIRYVIGDIRDPQSIRRAITKRTRAIYHVAALKHVDIVEDNAVEAVNTNVLGTINVAEAAIAAGVPYVAFSSTDKAVLPINVYGYTKGLCERYLLNLNTKQETTRFAVYRWANVLGSRGSVFQRFYDTLTAHARVDITDVAMTRFWIRVEDAVKYLLARSASRCAVAVPPMRAASVVDIAASVARLAKINDYTINTIGMRPGEKLHEVITWSHREGAVSSETAPRYSAAELDAMIAPLLPEQL